MLSVRSVFAGLFLMCLIGYVVPATAADTATQKLEITSDGFSPDHLTVAADERVKIMVHNKTALPAEFESYDFTAEKVVPGGTHVPVYIGPLKPGKYKFFNDFASDVTGRITVQ